MAYDGYASLRILRDGRVAFVTLDHPPINLFDRALMKEISRVGRELTADPGVGVVVFESADPEFFIAHADLVDLQGLPVDAGTRPTALHGFAAMLERYRTMPKVTIAKIEGRVRGGGSEFVLSLDLRFAARGRAVLGQPEVALGIIPGGTGSQRLPRLVGRARALEIILGCEDFSAELAERYGWVNRALPPGELGPFVERLAHRIASFPPEAIALAKAAVDAAELPTAAGLLEEAHCFNRSLATPAARRRLARALALGAQTREVERDLGRWLEQLGDGEPAGGAS
jgi:enoyl-CoA hydratase/carnithine racemase